MITCKIHTHIHAYTHQDNKFLLVIVWYGDLTRFFQQNGKNKSKSKKTVWYISYSYQVESNSDEWLLYILCKLMCIRCLMDWNSISCSSRKKNVKLLFKCLASHERQQKMWTKSRGEKMKSKSWAWAKCGSRWRWNTVKHCTVYTVWLWDVQGNQKNCFFKDVWCVCIFF